MMRAEIRPRQPGWLFALTLALPVIAAVAAGPAHGESDLKNCYGGDQARRLDNCTRIINDPGAKDDHASAYRYRAEIHEQAKDWTKAIGDYTQAIALEADDAELVFMRGRAYAETKDYRNAIADYSKAITLDPEEPEYRLTRGGACQVSGDTDGAIMDFSGAISVDPKSAAGYFDRAQAYIARGETDGAIADYTAATELDAKASGAIFARAELYRAAGQFDRAADDYDEAMRRDPKSDIAYLRKAEVLAAKHDVDGAIATLNHAVAANPNNPNTRNIRGFLLASKGDFKKAIADHTAAIVVEPLNAYRYNARAWTYLKSGDAKRALPDAELAVRFAPFGTSVYATRGLIFEKLGAKDKAIADLQKALSKQPGIEEARQALVRLGVATSSLPPVPAGGPKAQRPAIKAWQRNEFKSAGGSDGLFVAADTSEQSTAGPARFDPDAWLESKIGRSPMQQTIFARDDAVEVRAGPAKTFGAITTLRANAALTPLELIKYKTPAACGVDGPSAAVNWIRVRLSDGRDGYLASSDVVNQKQQKLLKDKALLSKIATEYYDKNSGSLSEFAGIYDGMKECEAKIDEDLDDPLALAMTSTSMLVKQIVWFEGNDMISVRFNSIDKPLRGRLSFWRNFNVAEGGTIKLYRIRYENGNTEQIGFFGDLLVIDPTLSGNSINYNYAKRCSNETGMVEWGKKVYEAQIVAAQD